MKTPGFQRLLLITGMSLLLAAMAFFGYKVHTLSAHEEEVKRDYSTTNNISFGLLSVSKWRDLMVAAIGREIQDFNFTPPERDSLQKEVTQVLNGLVDKADSLMNAPKKSIGGKLQKLAYHAFVHTDELHNMVPEFSKKITGDLMKPSSKHRLKYLATTKLEDIGQQVYDSSKDAGQKTVDSIYQKYHVADDSAFQKYTDATLTQTLQQTYHYTYALLGAVLLIIGLWYPLRKQQHLHVPFYVMSIVAALILLLVGLTTAMIDIDARINSLDFELLGETVAFKNQVIFFQSKSIFDVVRILIATGKYDSIFVGILILCFSIFFPVAKLSSTGIYLLSQKKWSKRRIVEYFAFQSGKWSMADVTVVAIFMAYIGFNGILNSQMTYLNQKSDAFSSIATNKTSLQPGYIVFVAFVVFGLALSQILKSITHHTGDTTAPTNPAKPAKPKHPLTSAGA
jgi:hypothetical protein